ncbi:hypothetical protein B0T26DRAFT_438119 [Lasiosphaeria miniovina]|uniref:Uncharacterized protein n=1 Tax=Lasiosphaeria miniovina TaxID=1954250 RepID=A0AA39ZYC8_9PEZI|nr:uncharacterized protein B0T26DRAFT_438119 [Lasiosphaeria miniovina]KAK0705910.1 hypothetical protein B0T26DRAFT_438119 [Lasiosphaeria miniovina]
MSSSFSPFCLLKETDNNPACPSLTLQIPCSHGLSSIKGRRTSSGADAGRGLPSRGRRFRRGAQHSPAPGEKPCAVADRPICGSGDPAALRLHPLVVQVPRVRAHDRGRGRKPKTGYCQVHDVQGNAGSCEPTPLGVCRKGPDQIAEDNLRTLRAPRAKTAQGTPGAATASHRVARTRRELL